MDLSLIERIQSLNDDLQQKILGYTYSPQPKTLLSDICDYRNSLECTKEYYFVKFMVDEEDFVHKTDANWMLDDMFEYVANNIFRIDYYEFWRRLYMLRNMTEVEINGYVCNVFFDKNVETQINIMWGLLTPVEREEIIYYGIDVIDTESELEDHYDY